MAKSDGSVNYAGDVLTPQNGMAGVGRVERIMKLGDPAALHGLIAGSHLGPGPGISLAWKKALPVARLILSIWISRAARLKSSIFPPIVVVLP